MKCFLIWKMNVKIFIFLSCLLNCLNGSQNDPNAIIQAIVSYPHKWIGFKLRAQFRNLVASCISDELEGKPLPKAFRGRKFILLNYYDRLPVTKAYLSNKEESENVKRFFDVLEEYFRIFHTREDLSKAMENLSPKEIHCLAEYKYLEYKLESGEVDRIRDLANLLESIKNEISSSSIGNDAFMIIDAIVNDVMQISLIRDYFVYHSNWEYCKRMALLGLTEHGDKKILQAQLNEQLKKFIPETLEGETNVVTAFQILKFNTYNIYLSDYVRKIFAKSAIELASTVNPPAEQQQVLDENFERNRILFFHYSKYFFKRTSPFYVRRLCTKLISACKRYNYTEKLFSALYEICFESNSHLFADLISPI
jgi:hypothetical protein